MLSACVGCLRTAVGLPAPTEEYRRLAAANGIPIEYRCSSKLSDSTVGHQFLFILIPFGRVELSDPDRIICSRGWRELLLRGYVPIRPGSRTGTVRSIELELDDVTMNGFDLLFVRRASVDATVRGSLWAPGGELLRSHETSYGTGAFRRYAFEKDLSELLEPALDEAVLRLFDHLGLAPNPLPRTEP